MPHLRATATHAPIGVFDSGVGGLSVLRALCTALPDEDFVYIADSGHAPYGERDDAHVLERAQRIAAYLTQSHGIKMLVVACNTATAAAIGTLRTRWPELPIVGMEPPLKPAAALTRTGWVGVMATRGTLQSEKFADLLSRNSGAARYVMQACDGLADAIERNDAPQIEALCARYTRALGRFGTEPGNMDVLVLGCTHYPFAAEVLARCTGPSTALLDAGLPVARRVSQLLTDAVLSCPARERARSIHWITTGAINGLQTAIARWMPDFRGTVHGVAIEAA